MGKRTFIHKTGIDIEPCPKCQNQRKFVGQSRQVAEDGCEVWVTCVCGFDPTENNTGHRMDDVWGSLDPSNLSAALQYCWNYPLQHPNASESQS